MSFTSLLMLVAVWLTPASAPLTQPELLRFGLPLSSVASGAVEQRDTPALFERIVVLGASLSAGYGLENETGTETSFSMVLDAAIVAEHGSIQTNAPILFFVDPEGYGRLMVDSTKALKPTLVIAIDFPFWFGYGELAEDQRLPRVERGLSLLEELDCTVIVGNFPDMSEATKGPLLSVTQVPKFETLSALNSLIQSWAAKLPNRLLVDLADHAARVQAKVDIPIGSGWEGKRTGELLQPDQLHPTLVGATLIAVKTAEVLLEGVEGLQADYFDYKIERVLARVKQRLGAELDPQSKH